MLNYKTKIMFIWGKLWHIYIQIDLFCRVCKKKNRIHEELKLLQVLLYISSPFWVGACSWSAGPRVSHIQIMSPPFRLAVATTPRAEHWLTAKTSAAWALWDFRDTSALTHISCRRAQAQRYVQQRVESPRQTGICILVIKVKHKEDSTQN